jgi:FkbM family methyltransferase
MTSSVEKPRRRGGVLLLKVAVAVALGLAAGTWMTSTLAEGERLTLQKYGPTRNSEHLEEFILKDFFQGKKNGVFVDVGAAHYKNYSNTYYLETELGWSGLAIDPMKEYAVDYTKFRPKTKYLQYFAGDASGGVETLFIPANNWWVASAVQSFASQRSNSDPGSMRQEKVPVSTLDDLLAKDPVRQIDFLSIDVELSEPKVLAGFNIEQHRPALVCIEAHPEVRQAILNYFAEHRYVVAANYLRADDHNLWFTPLPATPPR